MEHECSEEELAKNEYDQLQPEFDERDLSFVNETSTEMCNLLLNITTGEANSVSRRSLESGWLAWKRLTSPLNPHTVASGVKTISAVLAPANKADQTLDEWEDKLVKLGTESGQELTAKMKVAVLHVFFFLAHRVNGINNFKKSHKSAHAPNQSAQRNQASLMTSWRELRVGGFLLAPCSLQGGASWLAALGLGDPSLRRGDTIAVSTANCAPRHSVSPSATISSLRPSRALNVANSRTHSWPPVMPKDLQNKVLDECAVDQGNVAEHRQGKARDGRSETDGSGSRCRLERVALARRAWQPG